MTQSTSTQLVSKAGRMALAINLYKPGYFTNIHKAVAIYIRYFIQLYRPDSKEMYHDKK